MLRCKQRAGTFYLGIMFCSEFPGEGICRNPLLCIDSMSAEYGTERIYESFAEQKRDQTFMGDWNGRYQINWKGKGYLCGHHMKVRVQGSEKGTEIPAGAPVMVVGMEGFKPVVAQV